MLLYNQKHEKSKFREEYYEDDFEGLEKTIKKGNQLSATSRLKEELARVSHSDLGEKSKYSRVTNLVNF